MSDLAAVRSRLEDRRRELRLLSEMASESRGAVELDQQSVGRLSRQDALQQQAMAKAQDARRAGELRRIERAFQRVESGEYGFCGECGEAIGDKRLEIDPLAELCIGCAR